MRFSFPHTFMMVKIALPIQGNPKLEDYARNSKERWHLPQFRLCDPGATRARRSALLILGNHFFAVQLLPSSADLPSGLLFKQRRKTNRGSSFTCEVYIWSGQC